MPRNTLPASTLELVRRARDGDREAYDRLFALAADRVLLFVRLRAGKDLLARLEPLDILQEVYLSAHKDFARFVPRGRGSFSAWLCGIAANRMRDLVDYHGAKKRQAGGEQLPITRVLDGAGAGPTGPLSAAARVERSERLATELARLEDEEREALLLRFFEDLTIDEVAGRIGRSPTMTRRLLGKAMMRLGSKLEELNDVEA